MVETKSPFDNSIEALTIDVMVVKQERECTIWLVALVSITHKFSLTTIGSFTLEEKTECEKLGVKPIGLRIE